MDLFRLTLRQAVAHIRAGDVSAEDYARALLDRCERLGPLNAFILLDGDSVLNDAREGDRRMQRGEPLGPLHGVPLAIKDSFDVSGTPTTAGTPALQNNIARRTAPMVQRLFEAGALMLGKTNLYELAFGITSSNEFTGAVHNPYDRSMSAGGSSSGSAAAVAAGMAPAALGSDTAGSIRIPAAHCGIIGFRPSSGRYPSEGFVPLFHSRDAPGLMARSVDDVALLDKVITGDGDLPLVELRGLRIGLPRDYFFADLDSRVAAVVERELSRLQGLGVEFVEADAPEFADASREATGPIRSWELPRDIGKYLDEVEIGIGFDHLLAGIAGPYVRQEFERGLKDAGAEGLESEYRRVISEVLPRHRAEYRAYLRDNDLSAIAFPTTPLAPTPIDANDKVTVDGEQVSVWRTLRNAVPATLLGAPGLSIPAGLTAEGLPVGLEFDGIPGADRDLLSIGIAWERSSAKRPMPCADV